MGYVHDGNGRVQEDKSMGLAEWVVEVSGKWD